MDPGSHVGFQISMKNTNLVEGHPMNISGKFWLKSVQRFQRRGVKCEKLTDGRTTDAYPWQKLTWPMARWAKKPCTEDYRQWRRTPSDCNTSYDHLDFGFFHIGITDLRTRNRNVKFLSFPTINFLMDGLVWLMVFNATFNNISVIFWQSVLLVKETGVPGENHQPVASHWQTLSHNVVSSTHREEWVRTCNFRGDRHWLYR